MSEATEITIEEYVPEYVPPPERPGILEGFRKQFAVINALIFREILTRYGRGNIGFLWVIGEPILFCAGVSILWTLIRPAREHGLGMTALVVTGYVPLTMWRHCVGRALKAFEANGSLLFHRQVTPFDIITARCFIEIIGTIMAGLAVWFVAILFGFIKPPQDYFLLYLGFFYQSFFSLATGYCIASLSEISELVERCVNVISYLSLPFSGAFIMIAWLPPKYQWVLLLSPMANNIEMIRGGQFGPTASVHYNLVYNTCVTVLFLLFGAYTTFRVRKYLHVQ